MALENNTDDGSGAHSVSDIGTPTYTSGKLNNALTLSGTTQGLDVSALEAAINEDTTGTFAFWLNPDTDTTDHFVFAFSDASSTNDNIWCRLIGTGKLQFLLNDAGTTQWQINTTTDVSTGGWTHIVFVQDGVEPKIYVDGVLESSLTYVSDNDRTAWFFDVNSTNMDNGQISCRSSGSQVDVFCFDGQIDDFRYYSNSVLSQAEVTALYNDDTGTEVNVGIIDEKSSGTAHEADSFADAQVNASPLDGFDQAAKFNGAEYLSMEEHADFNITDSLTGNKTLDFWFKLDADPGGSGETFLYYQEPSGSDTWYWRAVIISVSDIRFNNRNASTTPVNMSADGGLVPGRWHHYAMIKVADEFGLYIDGNQIDYELATSAVDVDANADANLELGRRPADDLIYFNGEMESVRIYDGNPFSGAPVVGTPLMELILNFY
jgi:hypothetical protein